MRFILLFISKRIPVLPSTMNEGKYTNNLIDRVIKYFHEKHGVILGIEQAHEYLSSLADLYGSFVECVEFCEDKEEDTCQP